MRKKGTDPSPIVIKTQRIFHYPFNQFELVGFVVFGKKAWITDNASNNTRHTLPTLKQHPPNQYESLTIEFFLVSYNELASCAIKNHYAVTLFILFGLGLVLVLAYYTIFSPIAATMHTQACTGLYADSNHPEGYREVEAISKQRLHIRGQDEKDGPIWSAEAWITDEKSEWFSIVSTKQKPALKAFECACGAEGILWRKVGETQVVNIWKKVGP